MNMMRVFYFLLGLSMVTFSAWGAEATVDREMRLFTAEHRGHQLELERSNGQWTLRVIEYDPVLEDVVASYVLTADGHLPDELTVHSEEWMRELWFTGIEPQFITHQRGDKLTLWISGNVIHFKEYDIWG